MFERKYEEDIVLKSPVTFGEAMKIYKEIISTGNPKINKYYFNVKNSKEGICLTTDSHAQANDYKVLDFRNIECENDDPYTKLTDSYWKQIENLEVEHMNAWKDGNFCGQKEKRIRLWNNHNTNIMTVVSNRRSQLEHIIKGFKNLVSK